VGKLAASILSADHADLAGQVKLVEPHADVIHVDVMDAHFVPPLTIGAVVVASLRPHTGRTLHGHLMAEGPQNLFEDLAEAGMDMASFHVEAVEDPEPVIERARGAGMGVGIAMNGRTPVETVFAYLDQVDDVLLVTAGPASRGGAADAQALERIGAIRAEIDRRGLRTELEVEGGVGPDAARRFVEAGATVVVAGSAVFGAPDVAEAARRLKAVAEGGA
jgi:ribulose-phosphate 3-epimerase